MSTVIKNMIDWFEMNDLKKIDYNKTSWVPLCAYYNDLTEGEYGYAGHKSSYFSSIAIIFNKNEKEKGFDLDWNDANPIEDNSPTIDDIYNCAGSFLSFDHKLKGEYPVLQQLFYTGETKEWHLSQDLILALGLKREGDVWIRPEEDYMEVVKLTRKEDRSPKLLEIKTEHLKDYLSARDSGLLVFTYQYRRAIAETFNFHKWIDNRKTENHNWGSWQGIITSIAEGGHPYGSKTAVFHAARTDIDVNDDNPILAGPPTDENIKSESWEIEHKGNKLEYGSGEMWKKHWVLPADKSLRVRKDYIENNIEFIIDVDGKRAKNTELRKEGRWLWFKPQVVNELLKRRNSIIVWYTEDTGRVGTSSSHSVHFGMNSGGFINVYAQDISFLPDIQKTIWASYNKTPDAKVSKELLMSQVDANPADTFSPEYKLYDLLSRVDDTFLHKYGSKLFIEHDLINDYWKLIHRFRSIDLDGLIMLSKDLTRIVIERMNLKFLKTITTELPDNNQSIKRIEELVNKKNYNGRWVTSCLVGINELRHLDAHLPSSDYGKALELVDIKLGEEFPFLGKKLIDNVARSIFFINKIISEA